MHKQSKIIYIIVLCCFAVTATAGSIMCSCDMSDKTGTQQNPVDKTSKNCHTEQNTSSNESLNDCCPDMNFCSGSTLFVSNSQLMTAQLIHQGIQLPQNEQLVLKTSAPPRRPPKLIN